jgi:ribose/xylose/arabinose/galactoside ABC-type transport system permease subunit
MVTRFRFPAFIATLAMTSMAKGLMYIFSAIGREGGVAANVSCNNNDALNYIGKGFIGPIPFGVIVMLIFFLFYGILMSRTKFGMKVVLMGGNPVAANLAGINSNKISFILFINSAVLAASLAYSVQPASRRARCWHCRQTSLRGSRRPSWAAFPSAAAPAAWAARLSASSYSTASRSACRLSA